MTDLAAPYRVRLLSSACTGKPCSALAGSAREERQSHTLATTRRLPTRGRDRHHGNPYERESKMRKIVIAGVIKAAH
jgi:hypothetical protein